MMTKTPLGRFPARKMALSLAVAIASQALPALAQDDDDGRNGAVLEAAVVQADLANSERHVELGSTQFPGPD